MYSRDRGGNPPFNIITENGGGAQPMRTRTSDKDPNVTFVPLKGRDKILASIERRIQCLGEVQQHRPNE